MTMTEKDRLTSGLKTGFLFDERCLRHEPGPGHPESPLRLRAVMDRLSREAWFTGLKVFDRAAPAEENWLREIHSAAYLARARETCERGEEMLDSADVGVCPESFNAARLAAGGALLLADAVVEKEIQNGFALLRPPGHHAEADAAMGFCLLNNVAVLARYLQKKHGLEKILILDWDVHHGNGTQHAFEEDPSVFYMSIHQFPFYPGTGRASENGAGRGKGTTLNCPVPAGAGDSEYSHIFSEKIIPAAEAYKPDMILVSAGFDAHADDPLGQVQLSTAAFAWMTERVLEIAERFCQGRLVSLLEGGYNLTALTDCVSAHVKNLAEIKT